LFQGRHTLFLKKKKEGKRKPAHAREVLSRSPGWRKKKEEKETVALLAGRRVRRRREIKENRVPSSAFYAPPSFQGRGKRKRNPGCLLGGRAPEKGKEKKGRCHRPLHSFKEGKGRRRGLN